MQYRPGEHPGHAVLHTTLHASHLAKVQRYPRTGDSDQTVAAAGSRLPVPAWSLSLGTDERIAAASGSRNGSAAAGTVTPESSDNQPSTPISQIADKAGWSNGTAWYAPANGRARSMAGRATSTPATITTTGITSTNGFAVSDPRFAAILRRRVGPAPPCSTCPAKWPMSEWPVA